MNPTTLGMEPTTLGMNPTTLRMDPTTLRTDPTTPYDETLTQPIDMAALFAEQERVGLTS